jgi:hypothetical protein
MQSLRPRAAGPANRLASCHVPSPSPPCTQPPSGNRVPPARIFLQSAFLPVVETHRKTTLR